MSEFVERETDGPVALLTLKRPPINAIDETALGELAQAMDQVEDDPAIRVVIIASGINGIFCAGGDLKYWPRRYANRADIVSEAGQKVFARIEGLGKPCMAAIQGLVIGDGLSLALACDIRLASQDATFHLPELDYGFIPGWGTIGRLVEAIGKALTAELLLAGEPIGAARAQAMGLLNRVTAPDDLMPAARTLAGRMATKPPLAVRQAKAALRGGPAARRPDRNAWEAGCFAAVWGGREWRQGLQRLFNPTPNAEGGGSHG